MNQTEEIYLYTALSILAIAISIIASVVAMPAGPETGHRINLAALLFSTLALVGNISMTKKILPENSRKFNVSRTLIVISVLISFGVTINKYGYSNWIYSSPISLESSSK